TVEKEVGSGTRFNPEIGKCAQFTRIKHLIARMLYLKSRILPLMEQRKRPAPHMADVCYRHSQRNFVQYKTHLPTAPAAIMSDDQNIEIEFESSPALKVLLGREPILDRSQKLIGHEIVFRSSNPDPARQLADTSAILEQAVEAGIENLVGNGLGFVTATEGFLMGESVLFLPMKNTIIILPQHITEIEALSARVAELRRMGFRFAINHAQMHEPAQVQLAAQAEVIQITLPPPPQVLILNLEQLRVYRNNQKKLFAQQVQVVEQFEHCQQAGFDYFSGHFYAKPVFQENSKFSASEMTLMKALDLLNQDADDSKIEQVIKQDAVIGMNILKHVNSAASGMRTRIGSLKQAIQVIGHAQLQRWLQVMLYEKPGQQPSGVALFTLATARGKLLELLAKKQLPNSRNAVDIGFIVGLMSLMDTLFAMPMPQVLEKIPVYNEVKLALLERKGIYGELLQLVEDLEHLSEPQPEILQRLAQLDLAVEDLYQLQQQAFAWVNQLQ
ncbi:MAG: hypothetical protein RL748_3953, partial [Pseudomonadota bacterium]